MQVSGFDMKLSVAMITYNHEMYISQAVESILAQKVDFDYEIVIGEDCSTDSTRAIVKDYRQKYPDIIRLHLPDTNSGMMCNFMRTFNSCSGEYIALLEGDDYWTDPFKLQKQVDFLDKNLDFTVCHHNVVVKNEDYPERNRRQNGAETPEISGLDDLLTKGNFLATASVIIRANAIGEIPDWFIGLPFGDYPLYLLASQFGKIRYLTDIMGVYRIHKGGVHGHLTNSPDTLTTAYELHFEFWRKIAITGLFEADKLTFPILESLQNVINNAAKAKLTKVFLKYNFLFLRYAGIKESKKVTRQIIQYCKAN